MKTARFTNVVAAAGPPQVHPLWLKPDQDPALKRAVRDCRVMTVHQALRGTRKDYGTVGLHLEGSTQVLVFPKPLRRFGDRRIVGIDYDLIVQPEPKDPAPPAAAAKAGAHQRAVKLKPWPKTPAPPPANARPAVESPPRQRPARAAQPAPGPEPAPPTRDELLAEIHRAVRELKAGKAVAAYERLHGLIRAV